MSDQELRDKLAKHLDDTSQLHNIMGYSVSRAFKDGWDAARANDDRSDYFEMLQLKSQAVGENEELVAERDQLRELVEAKIALGLELHEENLELERKCEELERELTTLKLEMDKTVTERDQLRAEVERLNKYVIAGHETMHAELVAENDRLRAEVKRLKKARVGMRCSMCGEQYFDLTGASLYEERDRLKAMCEKLAAVLKDHIDWSNKYADGTQHDTEMEQALAEYEKMEKE